MRIVGGVDCTAEFASFLSANPRYIGVPSPDDGGPEFSQTYICIDGGVRYFDNAPLTPFEQFVERLSQDLNFRGLTDAGLTGLGAEPLNGALTLFAPGTGFFLFQSSPPEEVLFAYYDITRIGADNSSLLADNPSWTLIV